MFRYYFKTEGSRSSAHFLFRYLTMPPKLAFVVLLLFLAGAVRTQDNSDPSATPIPNPSENARKVSFLTFGEAGTYQNSSKFKAVRQWRATANMQPVTRRPGLETEKFTSKSLSDKFYLNSNVTDRYSFGLIPFSERPDRTRHEGRERFHWTPAIGESLLFLAWQHGFRMFQPRTRDFMGGPFFKDYAQSVKNLHGWADGDPFYINYVTHPLQGALTGRIFKNNSDAARNMEFSNSPKYWKTQLKVMAWEAFWSTQYEIGPLGEAAIGNVGLRKTDSHKLTWVDEIVTPTAGTAVVIAEDIIDKYTLKNWIEKRIENKMLVRLFRSLLTPSISFSNLFRFRTPWYRNDRHLTRALRSEAER